MPCRQFSLAEIQSATGDFSDLIGSGGFGKVYKGFIDNRSRTVAEKRLTPNSDQGRPEFETEIKTLSELRHRNIVTLIGYCNEQGEMILVYEYMENQTLAHHLRSSSLPWIQLLNILIGAARGLDHLHTGSSTGLIIHRDVKSTNILLDENFVAKVSDFGLARLLSGDQTRVNGASFKGTPGYIDPYYYNNSKLTRASDTYAYGIVLLEALTGKPAFDHEKGQRLSDWVLTRKARKIVASHLSAEISDSCLKICLEVAMRCLHKEPDKRPTMTQVSAQLEQALTCTLLQESGEQTRCCPLIKAFREKKVIPSCKRSTQEDHNRTGVIDVPAIQEDALAVDMLPDVGESEDMRNADMVPIVVPAIQEDTLEQEQHAVDMLPIDESEDTQNADMLPIDVPAIQEDALEHEQLAVDMLPIDVPAIQEDALEHVQLAVDMLPIEGSHDRQNANMQTIDVVSAFPLADIKDITGDFSDKYLIAKVSGGGSVFRGVLKSGQDVAIKKLNKELPDHKFMAQVSIISGLKHENVVPLLGYSVNEGVQVLVYEFAPRGSLHDILHGRPGMKPTPTLPWAQRIKIAVDVAKGLCYIHENDLIHHRIKSNNILLFNDENAKISDVCLSTGYPCEAAHGDGPSSPLPSGCCYHPAECGWTSGKSKKDDVHSYGMVVLELLTGQKPFDPTRPPGQQLALWVTPTLSQDAIKNIVDGRLEGKYPLKAAARMAAVAELCLKSDDVSCPDMTTVLNYLEKVSWETQLYLRKPPQ